MEFAHLHVHTEYSLLDGSSKIKELVAQTKHLGMSHIAITDHGVMYGAVDFYKEAKQQGITPIIGCEVYVAQESRFDRDPAKRSNFHLVLLAENQTGYQNLIKMVSQAFTEGFYYKPRIDLELLRAHHEGLICLSACLAGPVTRTMDRKGYEKAKEMALTYHEIFGEGNFYIELQDHGISKQQELNPRLIELARELNLPLVATNDVHYTYDTDVNAHDILLCIQTGKLVSDPKRMRYDGGQYYLKSPQEMYDLFPEIQEACANTIKIAKRCQVEFDFNEYKLPRYTVATGVSHEAYIEDICLKGLAKKYPKITDEIKERLYFELGVIKNMGYIDYFLITWDFIKYAKDNGIVVGPGRGSAAGSLVAYALDITTVDPIAYNLIFERFLNPERVSMPDIDIDFCFERRQEVIDYCINKYGKDHVAQIITFGTMAARGVIRDVGRVLDIPYGQVDTIAKLIPKELNITLEKALKMSKELRELYESREDIRYLIDMGRRLEGLPRHSSTHAAGVVITDQTVQSYVPLNQNDGVVATGYAMGVLEELGLLKMDFLGLRTLTVIKNAVEEVKRTQGIALDLETVDYEDPNVYKLLAAGDTDGVFQLESAGMRSFMKELKPDSFEDVIAGISLYRPGPMDFIPQYVAGKHKGNVTYTHPSLEPILKNTYGCIVYQEQVMEIVRALAGYSLGRSDLLRRAMGKKKVEVMEEERKNFIYGIEGQVPGCVNNGIPAEVASKIFDEMEDFAKYAFNKSHAAAYAKIGYHTAYLKTYYPKEFMAALMSSVMDNTSKIAEYIYACKGMGIEVLPPDINHSLSRFTVEGDSIRFGLLAVRNVGVETTKRIAQEREAGRYTSLRDFIERINGQDLNKRCLESLIKAGAFDSLGGYRSQYMEVHARILERVNKTKKDNIAGQIGLFDIVETKDEGDDLPRVEEYRPKEKLTMEKEVIGIYISGHPLAQYEKQMAQFVTLTAKDMVHEDIYKRDGEQGSMGGVVLSKTIHYTKSNQAMAFVNLEDMFGTTELVVFASIYEKHRKYFEEGNILFVKGKISGKEEEQGKIIVQQVKMLDDRELWLKISRLSSKTPEEILPILQKHSGETPVIIYKEKTKSKVNLGEAYHVNVNEALLADLRGYLGEGAVVVKG